MKRGGEGNCHILGIISDIIPAWPGPCFQAPLLQGPHWIVVLLFPVAKLLVTGPAILNTQRVVALHDLLLRRDWAANSGLDNVWCCLSDAVCSLSLHLFSLKQPLPWKYEKESMIPSTV